MKRKKGQLRRKILQLVKEHPEWTYDQVAKESNCSREMVRYYIAPEVKEGRLPPRKRGYKARVVKTPPISGDGSGLSKAVEALIEVSTRAAKVPQLEEQIWRLENQLAATKNDYEVKLADLKEELEKAWKEVAKLKDWERRYELAVQQGEIKTPLQIATQPQGEANDITSTLLLPLHRVNWLNIILMDSPTPDTFKAEDNIMSLPIMV